MLEVIVDGHLLFILMGIMTVLGLASKCVANHTLKKLVKAAGNMNKSTHALMRLVRAKFEHACMLSDRVQNVEVFVEKYLYEYKVLGCTLHSLQRIEKGTAFMCLLLGGGAAASEYAVYGMNDRVLQGGALGAGLAIGVFLFHLTTDEDYKIEVAKNYMVDYLENVCAHRYEKTSQKELQVMAPVEAELATVPASASASSVQGSVLHPVNSATAATTPSAESSDAASSVTDTVTAFGSLTEEATNSIQYDKGQQTGHQQDSVTQISGRQENRQSTNKQNVKKANVGKASAKRNKLKQRSAGQGLARDAAETVAHSGLPDGKSSPVAEALALEQQVEVQGELQQGLTNVETSISKPHLSEAESEQRIEEKPISKEVLIREILEEFLA